MLTQTIVTAMRFSLGNHPISSMHSMEASTAIFLGTGIYILALLSWTLCLFDTTWVSLRECLSLVIVSPYIAVY